MGEKELRKYLQDKPGYAKKGYNTLVDILTHKGHKINFTKKDLSKFRKEYLSRRMPCSISKKTSKKRLFYDIETSYNIGSFWRSGYNMTITPENIIHERAIICVSYKWEGENKVHTLKWDKGCDKELVTSFMKIMEEADELVGHNIDRYDTKFMRTRALKHGIPTLPKYTSTDTLKIARKYFNFNSNKLNYIAEFLGLGGKLKHSGFQMWNDIIHNTVLGIGTKKACKKSLKKMIKYCEKDVLLTEEVFIKLYKHAEHTTHYGVINNDDKVSCVGCGSKDLKVIKRLVSKTGTITRIMECNDCGERFIMNNTNYLKLIK